MLAILSMLCLISSYSFLSFYLAVELQSLCFYMLAGMRHRLNSVQKQV
jgi:NADH:ubiquinone oxidoreductase subunit 2 (subunit N)